MDGNMSFRRFRSRGNATTRHYDDRGLRIPREQVEKHAPSNSTNTARTSRDEGCAANAQGRDVVSGKASEHLDETGLFPLLCRHGVVWAYLDMHTTTGEG
jgi:hypothetical protein